MTPTIASAGWQRLLAQHPQPVDLRPPLRPGHPAEGGAAVGGRFVGSAALQTTPNPLRPGQSAKMGPIEKLTWDRACPRHALMP